MHLCPLPNFSGLEQYALLTAIQQKNRGHDVQFIVQKKSPLEVECAKAQIKTVGVATDSALPFLSLAGQYKNILLKAGDLDVLHLHSSQDIDRVGLALVMMKFMNPYWKRPKIVQQNHIWMSHTKKDPLHWLTYKAVDEVWCSSQPARASLEKYLPISASKIFVVNYGRELGLRHDFLSRDCARASLGLALDEVVIGVIARIDPAKGIWELVQATANCLKAGRDFTLVVIGGPTPDHPGAANLEAKLQHFLSSLPEAVRARIRLVGGIANAGTLLKAFDVYAQASYKETFSLALLDAQLAGLPVIGTSSGGTPEVVVEGVTGWLAEPESTDSLTQTFLRAFDQRDKWSSFGAAASARVEKDFALDRVTDSILRRYETSFAD